MRNALKCLAWLCGALILGMTGPARAAHPEVLITDADRDAVKARIEQSPWAKTAYDKFKAEVDKYVQLTQADPQFLTSRLAMNWQTHYTTPITKGQRWVGGDGHAPVPTPRFAGARDWATPYAAPPNLEDLKPFNDDNGKVWLTDSKTGQAGWVDPGLTGRTLEGINEHIEQLAADAGFLYWLTGDEKYAKFGSDILWTYMEGFSYVQPPQFPPEEHGTGKIIGLTSFEVIHESITIPLSESYDFLYNYLKKQGRDVTLIQKQLKRMADRIIDGGSREGNWNLNQAHIIAYAGLSLEDNASYPDGKGRPYYVDVVLNADLPAQLGLTTVIKHGYNQETALWPEAPGYGFGTTGQMVELASLMSTDPAGEALLKDPFLTRAILAQEELIYPNGWSVGVGDTDNTRLNAVALELLIASARKQSNKEVEDRLTAALQREIDSGNYDRTTQHNLMALTHYVGELHPSSTTAFHETQTYFATPLNVLMQRNLVDPDHSLAAAMYGTEGGHVHANGMAIELYGAGLILGADPGRGSSYWQADHAEYYSQPPAHNTVIVNGQSNYPISGPKHLSMKPELIEPALGQEGVDPNISFAQGSFRYAQPAADQQRTLALIRTGPTSGFYFDVFCSRADQEAKSFHDYLYHDIGQSLSMTDTGGKPLSLESSGLLDPSSGLLKGYGYFKNEKSAEFTGDAHGVFTTDLPDGSKHLMGLWVLGQKDRRLFTVDAPGDHAGRTSLPKGFSDLPMPTLVIRQNGEAWTRPFVCVYEPYLGSEGPAITGLRAAKVEGDGGGLAACVVEEPPKVTSCLMQDVAPTQSHRLEGYTFQGSFGVALTRDGSLSELYLGNGQTLGNAQISIQSHAGMPINAALTKDGDRWKYSASGAVKASLVFAGAASGDGKLWLEDPTNQQKPVAIDVQATSVIPGNGGIACNCVLPAAIDKILVFGKAP